MLLESQEDEGVLAAILQPEGAALAVGTPIAVFAPEGSDPGAAAAWRPPSSDVYDDRQPTVGVLEWQSYLKESQKKDGGCM
jgi:pyruvate/2-oxoglutarate dehydrogenase complex dihydrolipoamide acyltransferase (E2) component